MRKIASAVGAALLSLLSAAAVAQTFPSKPITFIVPSAPGGTADGIARLVAEVMARELNTSIVFDYVPGANGLLAQQKMLQSTPDGHTLFVSGITHALPMVTRPKQAVDMLNGLIPVSRMTRSAYALLVSKDSGIRSIDDMVKQAKSRQGGLFYGTFGAGSSTHLMMEHLRTVLGIEMTNVPFKGESQIYPELLANRVQVYLSATPNALIEQGALPLANTGETPWPFFPPMPTLNQSVPGVVYYAWSGLFGVKGTPDAAVKKLNAAANAALSDKATAEKLGKFGVEVWGSTAEQFADQIRSDLERFRKVIEAQKLTFED